LLAGTVFAAEKPPVPVLQLHFDEGQGTRCSDTASPPGGQVLPGQIGPLWVRGAVGSGLWFTGRNDECATIADRPELGMTDELTLSAWIWPSQLGGFQTIVWKGDRRGAVPVVNYRLTLRPEGRPEFSFKGPADEWYTLAASQPVAIGQWAHLVAIYSRGQARLYVNGQCAAQGRIGVYWPPGVKPGPWRGGRLTPNRAPLEIGRGQELDGGPGQCFRGAIDEVVLWNAAQAEVPELPPPPAGSPLESLQALERQFTAAELQATPYLTGRVTPAGAAWIVQVAFPGRQDRGLWLPGRGDAEGRFRYLLNDLGGTIDLLGAERLVVRAYRKGLADKASFEHVALDAGQPAAQVVVDPRKPLQRISFFGAYADIPKTFLDDPAQRAAEYGPLLAELREVGLTQLDFATLGQWIEPENDDADPQHIRWDYFRKNFQASREMQTLVKYLRYLESEGFHVGLRLQAYAGWQWETPAAGKRQPNPAEVAEHAVALLTLIREAGVHPTHFVPIWEPTYAPQAVADVCSLTARLARQHGIEIPIVGPYTYATGGQSTNMDAMPDRYSVGPRYVEPYLKTAGDVCSVIGVEDYASGCGLIEPNLKRLWREVIEPLSRSGAPKELWMLEYGSPCGVGPWNFYPSRWHGTYGGYDAAFRLARALHQQFNGRVSGFLFWKAYDVVGDGALISCCGLVKSPLHDAERRPLFYTARMFWKHIPCGARHIACTAEADVLANAFQKDRQFTVVLTNPRSTPVTAEVRLAGVELAPVARLYSSTAEIKCQEREVDARGDRVPSLILPPQSVSTLVCRAAYVAQPFARTVWQDVRPNVVYLSDLQWAAVSQTGRSGLLRDELLGQEVNVAQDENLRRQWIVLGGTRYRKGLGLMAPAEVVYDLDGRYTAFEAVVGVDDATPKNKSAALTFEVFLDGKRVFASRAIQPGDRPQEVKVSCAGAKQLTLSVINSGKAKDVLGAWAGARLVKQP
jgi:hypothetical protein